MNENIATKYKIGEVAIYNVRGFSKLRTNEEIELLNQKSPKIYIPPKSSDNSTDPIPD